MNCTHGRLATTPGHCALACPSKTNAANQCLYLEKLRQCHMSPANGSMWHAQAGAQNAFHTPDILLPLGPRGPRAASQPTSRLKDMCRQNPGNYSLAKHECREQVSTQVAYGSGRAVEPEPNKVARAHTSAWDAQGAAAAGVRS